MSQVKFLETGEYIASSFLRDECGIKCATFSKVVQDDGFGNKVAKVICEGIDSSNQLVRCWMSPIKGQSLEDIAQMPDEISDVVIFFPEYTDEETGEVYTATQPSVSRYVADGMFHRFHGGKRQWHDEEKKYEFPNEAE